MLFDDNFKWIVLIKFQKQSDFVLFNFFFVSTKLKFFFQVFSKAFLLY